MEIYDSFRTKSMRSSIRFLQPSKLPRRKINEAASNRFLSSVFTSISGLRQDENARHETGKSPDLGNYCRSSCNESVVQCLSSVKHTYRCYEPFSLSGTMDYCIRPDRIRRRGYVECNFRYTGSIKSPINVSRICSSGIDF